MRTGQRVAEPAMTERAPAIPRAFAGRACAAPPGQSRTVAPCPPILGSSAPPRLSSPCPGTLQLAGASGGVKIRVIQGYQAPSFGSPLYSLSRSLVLGSLWPNAPIPLRWLKHSATANTFLKNFLLQCLGRPLHRTSQELASAEKTLPTYPGQSREKETFESRGQGQRPYSRVVDGLARVYGF